MLTLKIGKRVFPVNDLAEASSRYQQFRGIKPSSLMPPAFVFSANYRRIARISYNGRVWPDAEWHEGMRPILEATSCSPLDAGPL